MLSWSMSMVTGIVAGIVTFHYCKSLEQNQAPDTNARKALVAILERFGDSRLSSLGNEIKDIALKGLK